MSSLLNSKSILRATSGVLTDKVPLKVGCKIYVV